MSSKLLGLNAIQSFLAAVGDVPFCLRVFAAGAEAKQEIAADLVASCSV